MVLVADGGGAAEAGGEFAHGRNGDLGLGGIGLVHALEASNGFGGGRVVDDCVGASVGGSVSVSVYRQRSRAAEHSAPGLRCTCTSHRHRHLREIVTTSDGNNTRSMLQCYTQHDENMISSSAILLE